MPDVKSVEGKCLLISAPSVSISPVWGKILISVKNVEFAGRSRKCDIFFCKIIIMFYLSKIHVYILVYESVMPLFFILFIYLLLFLIIYLFILLKK